MSLLSGGVRTAWNDSLSLLGIGHLLIGLFDFLLYLFPGGCLLGFGLFGWERCHRWRWSSSPYRLNLAHGVLPMI